MLLIECLEQNIKKQIDCKRPSNTNQMNRVNQMNQISENSRKNICARVSFFNKVPGLRPEALLKKRLWYRCFSVNFEKFLRTPFFTEYLQETAS